jgi:hypothetical protein
VNHGRRATRFDRRRHCEDDTLAGTPPVSDLLRAGPIPVGSAKK